MGTLSGYRFCGVPSSSRDQRLRTCFLALSTQSTRPYLCNFQLPYYPIIDTEADDVHEDQFMALIGSCESGLLYSVIPF